MTLIEPLSVPLDISYRSRGDDAMKRAGVKLVYCDAVWDTIRHYKPEHWEDILFTLSAHGAATRRYFDRK